MGVAQQLLQSPTAMTQTVGKFKGLSIQMQYNLGVYNLVIFNLVYWSVVSNQGLGRLYFRYGEFIANYFLYVKWSTSCTNIRNRNSIESRLINMYKLRRYLVTQCKQTQSCGLETFVGKRLSSPVYQKDKIAPRIDKIRVFIITQKTDQNIALPAERETDLFVYPPA